MELHSLSFPYLELKATQKGFVKAKAALIG
jgi:hypothetical protein